MKMVGYIQEILEELIVKVKYSFCICMCSIIIHIFRLQFVARPIVVQYKMSQLKEYLQKFCAVL